MIPTIETIVEDLDAGKITKQQAIAWLNMHAETACASLRDDFAASVIGNLVVSERRQDYTAEADAIYAYTVADAMMAVRTQAPNGGCRHLQVRPPAEVLRAGEREVQQRR